MHFGGTYQVYYFQIHLYITASLYNYNIKQREKPRIMTCGERNLKFMFIKNQLRHQYKPPLFENPHLVHR